MRPGVAISLVVLVLLAYAAGPAAAAEPEPGSACAGRPDLPWCDPDLTAERRAELLLAAMTLEEKIGLMGGDDPAGVATADPANGTSEGIPRLAVPTVYFNDGPAGVREGEATAMPAPAALAAGWSPRLARSYGQVVANENYLKGNHVIHAPATNMVRAPEGGRVFEYFGEDPHLAGRITVDWIRGAQSEPQLANVKHYVANNQETDRFVVNAVVDERTLREAYLPAFEVAVTEADVASVMIAYNRVNGEPMTENQHLTVDVLRGDFGFTGFTLTDYGFAMKSTSGPANAGTDLEMPQAGAYSQPALQAALAAGTVQQDDIDRHVTNIVRTMFRFGLFDSPPPPDAPERIDYAAHADVARVVAEQGSVLLRNEGPALPLDGDALESIAVIGPKADEYQRGGGSSMVTPRATVTPLEGIRDRAGPGIDVRHDDGRVPQQAAQLAARSDVAVVVVNDNQTEFVDKPCLTLQCGDPTSGDQDGLVRAVAAANPRTVVVMETGAPSLTPWRDEVAAILKVFYPGQEGGTAIARVLFGDVDPGGRLPYTMPDAEGDPATDSVAHPERFPGIAENALYTEGVFFGYRHYDENGIEPAYAFGHGLSYGEFRYRGLRVQPAAGAAGAGDDARAATVSVEVTNTGDRRATEVVQLYVGKPEGPVPQPPSWLIGFRKLELDPGERRRVRLGVSERELAYWDAGADRWAVAPGCYRLKVGRSSRDIRAEAELPRGGVRCAQAPAPAIRLGLRCRGDRAVASLRGRDLADVRRVTFRGERSGGRSDARRPFRRTLGARRFGGRRWTVRAVARLAGGTTVRLRRARRACTPPGRGTAPRFTG